MDRKGARANLDLDLDWGGALSKLCLIERYLSMV